MKVLGLNIHFNCLYCILNYLLNIFKNIFFRTFLIVFFSYNANCQFIQQSNKLVELDGKSSNYFGASVSISGDGKTAIIGARNANSFNGCAYIYSKIGNNWIQKAKLFSDMHEGAAKQGYSVSISFDGNTVAYGGPDDNLGNGAVWIFIKLDGIWTQQGPKIVGNESIGSGFGTSISISNDGNSFVTGGPSSELGIGAVWVYNRVSGIWTPDEGKIVGTGSAAGGATNQGISVAMSGNARTIIFGGYKDSAGIGGAWIFVKNGNVWTPQSEKIIPNDYVGTPYFGSSVTISTDGSTAAVGGYKDATDIGAIWIYSIVNGTWVQQGPKLTASDITGAGNLGSSCSLSSDGRTLLASGGKDNTNSGAVWLFKKNTVWEQIGTKILGSNKTGSSSFQGGSIDISSNGSTLICGGYGDNLEAGAAWFFQEMPKLFLNGPTSPVAITTDKTSTLLFSISHGGVSNSQEGYLHYFISKDFIYD